MVMATINTAHVPEEQKKNQRDQNNPVSQIAQHGMRSVMHQLAAVEMRHKLHALRQQASLPILAVKFIDLLMQCFQSRLGDSTLAEQDDPFDDIVVVDDRGPAQDYPSPAFLYRHSFRARRRIVGE